MTGFMKVSQLPGPAQMTGNELLLGVQGGASVGIPSRSLLDVPAKQDFAGAAMRTQRERNADSQSIREAGASTAGAAADNDGALAAVAAVSSYVLVPAGVFPITAASLAHLDKVYGPGTLNLGGVMLPAGDIRSNLTLLVPTVFPNFAAVFAYLSARRVRSGAIVTIFLPAGLHVESAVAIEPYHPDGKRIQIIGAGSGSTMLRVTGLGSAMGLAGILLDGDYQLGMVNALTLDGDDWNGHSAGGPTLGAGDPADPIGIACKRGAQITIGSDLVVRRFARNGIFAFQGSTIRCQGAKVIECGSDGFVSSMGSNVNAQGCLADGVWGVGFYADYAGVILTNGATATNTKYRGVSTGGDGFAANYGGLIHGDGMIATKNQDSGFTAFAGRITGSGLVAGGGAANANGGYGLRILNGGSFFGDDANASYNGGGGVQVAVGSTYTGDRLIANNNTGVGASLTDGSKLVSTGYVSKSNTSTGISASRGSHASILNCDIQSNGSHGISADGASTVRATGALALKSNTGFGAQARNASTIDMNGVSEAIIITGNTSGTCSPGKDTTTGIAQSVVYAAA